MSAACIAYIAAAEAFQAPLLGKAPSVIMKAAADLEPLPWADPIAAHGSALSMNDIPFDPLNLASAENLDGYREAELKHGRLAMLAALGWPAAEEFEPILAKLSGRADELIETGGRAPSLLNGGLEESQIPFFLLGAFSIAGYSDWKGTQVQKELKLEPGNVNFDPLGLLPSDEETVEKFKLAELKHGRIAMVAITLYALEEGTSQTSILKETVPLFKEIGRLIAEGPVQGNIDLVKDLNADAKALIADSVREEEFYGNAFTQKVFDRPAVHDVEFKDVFALSIPALIMAAAAAR